jgi:hypothetical protein
VLGGSLLLLQYETRREPTAVEMRPEECKIDPPSALEADSFRAVMCLDAVVHIVLTAQAGALRPLAPR